MEFTYKEAEEALKRLEYIIDHMRLEMRVDMVEHDEDQFSLFIDREAYEITKSEKGHGFCLIEYVYIPQTHLDPPFMDENQIIHFDTLAGCIGKILEIRAEDLLGDYEYEQDMIAEEEGA